MDAALMEMILRAIPKSLPDDLRADIAQEMAVGALDGDFDLSDLGKYVAFYRRKIYRLSANRFKFISIDSVIPGTTKLTYADTLVG